MQAHSITRSTSFESYLISRQRNEVGIGIHERHPPAINNHALWQLLLIQGIQKVPEDDTPTTTWAFSTWCSVMHMMTTCYKGSLDLSLIFYKGIQIYNAHHVAIAKKMHPALPTMTISNDGQQQGVRGASNRSIALNNLHTQDCVSLADFMANMWAMTPKCTYSSKKLSMLWQQCRCCHTANLTESCAWNARSSLTCCLAQLEWCLLWIRSLYLVIHQANVTHSCRESDRLF